MSRRAIPVVDAEGRPDGYLVECPACGCAHHFDKRWTFSGTIEKPTFKPSMLVRSHPIAVCHSYVTDGRIEFLPDCSHAMAGQTVDLPEVI